MLEVVVMDWLVMVRFRFAGVTATSSLRRWEVAGEERDEGDLEEAGTAEMGNGVSSRE